MSTNEEKDYTFAQHVVDLFLELKLKELKEFLYKLSSKDALDVAFTAYEILRGRAGEQEARNFGYLLRS